MGELDADDIADLAPEIAGAVHEIATRPGWDVDAALAAAALVLAAGRRAAGRRRCRRGSCARRPAAAPVPPEADGIRAVAAVERRLAAGPVLFPAGIPEAWRGANLEAHGLPAGPASTRVVRRALARRAPGRAVGGRRRPGRAARRPPSTRPGARAAPTRRGPLAPAPRDRAPRGGQRRATSTRRWAKSRSTGAPVSRWR